MQAPTLKLLRRVQKSNPLPPSLALLPRIKSVSNSLVAKRLHSLKSLIYWVTLTSFWYFTEPAWADFFIHHWESFGENFSGTPELQDLLRVDFQSYSTSRNFDPTGNSVLIPSSTGSSGSLTRLQTDFSLYHAISPSTQVYGRLGLAALQQAGLSTGEGAFGLTDQSIGLNTEVPLGTSSSSLALFSLQFQLDFPAYKNSSAAIQKSLYLGDGTFDFSSGFFLTLPVTSTHHVKLNGILGAAYTYRTDSFSSALPWSFFMKLQTPSLKTIFELGLIGLQSFRTDEIQNSPTSHFQNLGSGGSLLTGAINPSLTQFKGRLGYCINSLSTLSIRFQQSLGGQSAPEGWSFGLEYQFNILRNQESTKNPQDEFKQAPHPDKAISSPEAIIVSTNDRLNLVKINKGSQDGIEEGQIFTFFKMNSLDPTQEPVGRGRVIKTRPQESAVEVTEYFTGITLEEGFLAKLDMHPGKGKKE